MSLRYSHVGFAISTMIVAVVLGTLAMRTPVLIGQVGGICADGLDNDADGKVDMQDSYCIASGGAAEIASGGINVNAWSIPGTARVLQSCGGALPCSLTNWVGAGGSANVLLISNLSAGDAIQAGVLGTVSAGGGVQINCANAPGSQQPGVMLQFTDNAGAVIPYPGGTNGAIPLSALQNEIIVPAGATRLVGGVADATNSDNSGSCTLKNILVFGAHANTGATCTIVSAPDTVTALQPFQAVFSLTNNGTTTWIAAQPYATQGYKLMSLDPHDNSIWGQARIGLPHDVAPGETVTVIGQLAALGSVGPNSFAWEMGNENVGRFGQQCRKTVTITAGTVQQTCPTGFTLLPSGTSLLGSTGSCSAQSPGPSFCPGGASQVVTGETFVEANGCKKTCYGCSVVCPANYQPFQNGGVSTVAGQSCLFQDPQPIFCPGGLSNLLNGPTFVLANNCNTTCYGCSSGTPTNPASAGSSSSGNASSACPSLTTVMGNTSAYYSTYTRDAGPIASQMQLDQNKNQAFCDAGDRAVFGQGVIATCGNCSTPMLEYNGRIVVNGREGWESDWSYDGNQIVDTIQTTVTCLKFTSLGASTLGVYEVINTGTDFYSNDQDRSRAFCNVGDVALYGSGNPRYCDDFNVSTCAKEILTLVSNKKVSANGAEGWEIIYDLDGNGKSDTQRTSVTCLQSACAAVGFCANSCGDGTVIQGEECDHGSKNGTPGDSCSVTCKKVSTSSSAGSNGTNSSGSSASSVNVCTVQGGNGVSVRGTHTGDYDGFGIGLAPNVSYADFNAFKKSCDEPPSMDYLTYGSGWGNRPLTGDYTKAQLAQPFKVYLPPIPANATVTFARAIFVTADLDDGQPSVKDRLFINNIEVVDAFKNAGQAQYLPGKAGKTAQIDVPITNTAILTSLRNGNISVMVDDTTTGTSEPEGFSIDYVAFYVNYKCDNPGPNPEACNGMDDDCDGVVDEGLTVKPYYVDMDGNGKYGTFVGQFCANPGYGSLTLDEACALPSTAKQCGDGADNDFDNKVDALDPGCHTDGNAGNSATYDPQKDDESDANCVREVLSGNVANVPNPDPDNGINSTFSENLDCAGWNAFLSALDYKDGTSDSLSLIKVKCKPLNLNATLGAEFTITPSAQYTASAVTPVSSTCPAGTIAVGIYQKDVEQSDLLDGAILACAPLTTAGVGAAQPPITSPSDLSTNARSYTPVLCPPGYALTGLVYKGLGVSDSINTLHCQAVVSFCKP